MELHIQEHKWLFKKDADIATFAIPKAFTIYELVSGEENRTGATYKVKPGAVPPFSIM